MHKTGVILVSLQGLNKGQTVDVIEKVSGVSVLIKPHGSNKTYNYPIKYLMNPEVDYEYPRNQEVYSIWSYGK